MNNLFLVFLSCVLLSAQEPTSHDLTSYAFSHTGEMWIGKKNSNFTISHILHLILTKKVDPPRPR